MTVFEILVADTLRFSHLLAIAVGIGVAVETETYLVRRRRTKISPGMMTALDHRHRVILTALGVMWVTGIALVALRTGFQFEAFTPKLWAKIVVVTVLTINALFVSQVALPVMASHVGRPIASLPRRAQSAIFSVAGISATSWLLALALGSSALLKVSPAPVFQSGLPLAYIAGILTANAVGRALFAPRPLARTPVATPPRAQSPAAAPNPSVPAERAPPKSTKTASTVPPRPAKPAATLRASDLAIAFPQKLKRAPRMKPLTGGPPAAADVTRAELARIASELGNEA